MAKQGISLDWLLDFFPAWTVLWSYHWIFKFKASEKNELVIWLLELFVIKKNQNEDKKAE